MFEYTTVNGKTYSYEIEIGGRPSDLVVSWGGVRISEIGGVGDRASIIHNIGLDLFFGLTLQDESRQIPRSVVELVSQIILESDQPLERRELVFIREGLKNTQTNKVDDRFSSGQLRSVKEIESLLKEILEVKKSTPVRKQIGFVQVDQDIFDS